MLEKRKKTIQTRFLNELSLRVDFPKQGFGTTNDGNNIGYFTEEVLETSHKICKLIRKCFSRKTSRLPTNIDIFQRLLLCSDPFISMLNVAIKE